MIVLVQIILVILLLDATHLLFLVMIMMLAPMMIVTLDPDVPTSQEIVMTTILVPMITVIKI
jgi:hypothetical protein